MPLYHRTALTLTQSLGACAICADNPIGTGFLCDACHEDLSVADPFLLHEYQHELPVMPAFAYAGVVGRAIRAFKDVDDVYALPILVHGLLTLSERLDEWVTSGKLSSDCVILPVPTTNGRLVERGSYTVGILADYFSKISGFSLYAGVMRTADGVRQRGLGRDERLSNVKNAFVVNELPDASSLIIFDDVITTGATVGALADVLWSINPKLQIVATCVAHGD